MLLLSFPPLDWHTLLEAPLVMQNVTEEFFPKGMDWHRYMTLVAKEAGILPKIEFGVEVQQVLTNKDAQGGEEGPCLLLTNGARRCAKHRLFIGTGLKGKETAPFGSYGSNPVFQGYCRNGQETTSLHFGQRQFSFRACTERLQGG